MNDNLSFFNSHEMHYWNGIRGWLLRPAAEMLHETAKIAPEGGVTLEVGSFAGKSTVCIAKGLKLSGRDMTCIDLRFQPDFLTNIGFFGYNRSIRTLQGPSLDHVADWASPISYLYIDGHHGKGYALSDLFLWDLFVIPGGYVALDDTIGFMIGPNLQVQAMIAGGCYTFIEEAGGVSFLRKNHSLSSISYYPLKSEVWFAQLHFSSARLGAMDPYFRQPKLPAQRMPMKEWINRFWNTSPSETTELVLRKLSSKFRKPNRVNPRSISETAWLLEHPVVLPGSDQTLEYLRGCEDFRAGNYPAASEIFSRSVNLPSAIRFTHFNLPIRDMALLRVAQVYDIMEQRKAAVDCFRQLAELTEISELREIAVKYFDTPFVIPSTPPTMLLREFALDLNPYKLQRPCF